MAVIRRLAVCAAVLLVMLALVDICLRGFSYWTRLPFSVVDIQTQETLRAKLMDLKGRQGLKIVAFGDSVVYGASMAGIPGLDWRNATLDRVLEGDLRRDLGRNDVHVMNLGMNGFLYTDMQMLAQLLQQSDVDAYVFNVSLRSFSSDFSDPADQVTRAWLKPYAETGRPSAAIRGSRLDRWLEELATRYWYAYRIKGTSKNIDFRVDRHL